MDAEEDSASNAYAEASDSANHEKSEDEGELQAAGETDSPAQIKFKRFVSYKNSTVL